MIKRILSVPITIIIIASATVNAVLFSAALPEMSRCYHVDSVMSQRLVSIFLLGYAVAQLVFGPISSVYGRKKTLIFSISLGTLGSALSILSIPLLSYDAMYYGRVISGFGIGSVVVIGFTMINESHNLSNARKVTTICAIAFALAPGIATFIGSFIISVFGWKSCFYFLLLFNILIIILAFNLPDTLKFTKRKSLNLETLLIHYIRSIMNYKVTISGFINAMVIGMLYAVVALLPFVAITTLKMNTIYFGIGFFVSYLGYFVGSIICLKSNKYLLLETSIKIGLGISALGGIFLLIITICGLLNLWLLFISLFIVFCGIPIAFSNAMTLGIKSHKDKASGCSMISFIYLIVSYFTVNYIGFISLEYLYLLIIVTVSMPLIGLILVFFIKERVGLKR